MAYLNRIHAVAVSPPTRSTPLPTLRGPTPSLSSYPEIQAAGDEALLQVHHISTSWESLQSSLAAAEASSSLLAAQASRLAHKAHASVLAPLSRALAGLEHVAGTSLFVDRENSTSNMEGPVVEEGVVDGMERLAVVVESLVGMVRRVESAILVVEDGLAFGDPSYREEEAAGKARVAALEKRERELGERIAAAEAKLSTLSTLLSAPPEEEEEREREREDIGMLRAELVERNATIAELQSALDRIETAAAASDAARSVVHKEKGRVKAAERKVEEAAKAQDVLHGIIADLQETNRVLHADLRQARANLQATTVLKSGLDESMEDPVYEYIQDVIAEYRHANSVVQFEADKGILQAKLKAHKTGTELEKTRAALDKAKLKLKLKQAHTKAHEMLVSDLEHQIAQLQAENARLKHQDLALHRAALVADVQALERRKSHLSQMISSLDSLDSSCLP